MCDEPPHLGRTAQTSLLNFFTPRRTFLRKQRGLYEVKSFDHLRMIRGILGA